MADQAATTEELKHRVAVLVRRLGQQIDSAPSLARAGDPGAQARASIEASIVLLVRAWLELGDD